jgi:aminoglycoside/choline kinase family phosphotransferase
MDVAFLMNEVRIFMDWALPCMECADADHAEVLGWWQAMLTPLETQPFGSILTLRDVHSENLMIVAHKDSAMCGLLDFQDAMWGPPSYDVVSMLQDVRLPFDARASETRRHAIAQHLTARTKVPPEAFEWPYDLLGLQRAVKIFGVFSRLALQDKNTSMMRYLPNTARWILHGLQAQNAPAPLTVWFNKLDLLGTLKARHDLT